MLESIIFILENNLYMKKLIISAMFLCAGFAASAQQDAQFTQYMFNKLSVNPGSAGNNGGICATLLHRAQWTGFEGAPVTTLFSGDVRLNKHGIGLTAFQDKLGIEKTFSAKLAYAYHIILGPGELGIGLDVGMVNKSFGNDFIAIDDYTQDPSIPNANTSATSYTLGFGLFYSIKNKMYVGISSLNIPQSEINDNSVPDGDTTGSALSYLQSRHYYVMAGYDWDINKDSKWIVKPSLLAKTDASSTQLDFTAVVLYNKLIWAGVTYRLDDAIAGLVGVYIPGIDGLKVGFSYDYTTSSLNNYSNGSLEFMVNYCTSISKPPKREAYKSVRFL